ncbi:hypothetical protein Hanom_Chr16g01426191 [Helianthus anomalus]
MNFTQWHDVVIEVVGTDSLSHHKWGWHGLAEDSKLSAAREATRAMATFKCGEDVRIFG